MESQDLVRVLLLCALLLTAVGGDKDSVFVYSTLGGAALLPCTKPTSPGCSSITWTFFKGGQIRYMEVVSRGRVRSDSDKLNRASLTANCSLVLQGLVVEDTGSYMCQENQQGVTDAYLSLLSIRSTSPITELQPGGHLLLRCILFTFYDAGSCKAYSNVLKLQWLQDDGMQLPNHSRYQLIENSRCNVTLLTELRAEDDNRRWRCQVTTGGTRATFLDFRSSFVFQAAPVEQSVGPSVTEGCPVELPVSRILLCVALPLMVSIVGFFMWKSDHKKEQRSAADIELRLQEVF